MCAASRRPYLLHHQQEVEDLAELFDSGWNEERVLQNCRMRFLSRKTYTAAGSIMIAVNPHRSLSELHDRHMQLKYFRYNKTDLPAHAYAVSAETYWALCEGPQTIMFGGECGAGKSFTAFVLLEHLVGAASLSRSVCSDGLARDNEDPHIKGQVGGHQRGRLSRLMTCRRTILESFGNAATPSNPSSSRFMAHTKVFFSQDATRVLGVEGQTLLLETSRLSSQSKRHGEMAFHIFYQVLDADPAWKERLRLVGETAADFGLSLPEPVPCEDDDTRSGVAPGTGIAWASGSARPPNPDSNDPRGNNRGIPSTSLGGCKDSGPGETGALHNVLDAMKTIGVTEGEREDLLKGVSAVLHLGRIDFVKVRDEDIHRGFGVVEVIDEVPLEAASEMLGCNKHHLRNALLTRTLAAGGEGGAAFVSNGGSRRTRGGLETLTVPLDRTRALRMRDKLIQELYLRLFRWLVKRMNACTGVAHGERATSTSAIGLLDTCGVENIDPNGFEQLCRNYAAEKLHGQFLQDEACGGGATCSDADSGTSQGLSTEAAVHVENKRQLLDMFEGTLGLIHLADDECVCPEGSSQSFVNKLLLTAEEDLIHKQPKDSNAGKCAHDPKICVAGGGRKDPCDGVLGGTTTSGTASTAWAVLDESHEPKEPCFHIKHFTGTVRYTVSDLLEKNNGGIGQSLLDLLDDACSNDLVGELSRSGRYRDGRSATTADGTADHRKQNVHQRRMNESVLSQHRRQINALLEDIDGTKVRHILSVKPNNQRSADFFDDTTFLRQLSTAGVVAATERGVRSLPRGRRVDKDTFFKDFRIVPGATQRRGDCCKLGHSTIRFREGVWESLERQRKAIEVRSCKAIQRVWRQHALRVYADAEWQRYLSAEAQRRATAEERHRRQEEDRMQAWETHRIDIATVSREATPSFEPYAIYLVHKHRRSATPFTPRRTAVFASSHANAVREGQRMQEASQAAAAAAEQEEEKRSRWLRNQALENEARLAATVAAADRLAAERALLDEAVRINTSLCFPPLPPTVAQAWPIHDNRSSKGNETENAPKVAPTSTTPPASPGRYSLPVCSPIADRSQVGRRGAAPSVGISVPERARRIIPRLDGLANYAMRAFLTEPLSRKYGMIRCRVTRHREGSVWNPLKPSAYCLHHVEASSIDGMDFMMSATRQPLTLTTNYHISTSLGVETDKDTRKFLGKLRARDTSGSSYILFDDGINPRRSSKDHRQGLFIRTELARIVFSATQDAADGPRSMEALIPSSPALCGARDAVQCRYHYDSIVHMQDRKPRYDPHVDAYVLDFLDPMSKLSVKNVQLVHAADDQHSLDESCRGWNEEGGRRGDKWWARQESTFLSFGKSDTDEFSLDFRHPLSPMQAFGLALAALDSSI
ncbi:unnamed protein product [Scytosiphon promiscuus]